MTYKAQLMMQNCTYLQPSIQGSGYGDAFGAMSTVCGDCSDQAVQFVALFLELFHQAFDGSFAKLFRFAALPMTHERMDNAHASIGRGRGASVVQIVHDSSENDDAKSNKCNDS